MGGEVKYDVLQEIIHNRVVDLRAIRRLVSTEKFAQVWRDCSQEDKVEFLALAKDVKRESCYAWFDMQVKDDLNSFTVRQLRIMARLRGVDNYHHADKATLLTELRKHVTS